MYYNIQYKHKYQSQWTSVPERIPATQEKTVIRQLVPDRDYILMVTAHSEAGVTQGEYKFRTLPLISQQGKFICLHRQILLFYFALTWFYYAICLYT